MKSSLVINSHLRCTSFGLKRRQILSQVPAGDALLKELCRQNSGILEEAEAVLGKLEDSLFRFAILVALTEGNGTILSLWGDLDLQEEMKSIQFQPGANWREEKMGTNAIGIALVEGVPIQVEGEDHFFHTLANLSMAAAPILDLQGRLLGTFAIVSRLPDSFRLSMPIAILAADSIQARLQFRDHKSQRSQSLGGFSIHGSKHLTATKVLFQDIYSNCPVMDRALALARKSVSVEENVLLTGEIGTGKEMIARAIHNTSRRKDQPFVYISCSSIQDPDSGQLLAAQENHFIEKILEANKGTIYLDEITELSERSVVLLQRLISEKSVVPYGDSRAIPVDVRILSSTSRSINRIVRDRLIQPELFFRLKGVHIDIPSLRERSDIIGLAKHFLRLLDCPEYTIDSQAQKKLLTHHWTGNVRELQGVILKAAFLAENGVIQESHIQLVEESSGRFTGKYILSAKEMEKIAILEAMTEAKGNISRASEILGLGRSTLYRKFKRYNISPRTE